MFTTFLQGFQLRQVDTSKQYSCVHLVLKWIKQDEEYGSVLLNYSLAIRKSEKKNKYS